MTRPDISVIVAVRNAATTLDGCLASVAGQQGGRWELVAMDGASSDGSTRCLAAWDKHLAYWESRPDRGVYDAWNKGLDKVSGEWVCFLGADDYLWSRTVFHRLRPWLQLARQRRIRLVYGRGVKVTPAGRVIKRSGRPWSRIRWQMAHGMPLIHAGVLHHRSLFNDRGRFDASFRIAGDYELLLRELLRRPALFAAGVRTVVHRAGGLSDRQPLETLREIARARRRHLLPAFSWVWTVVYLRAGLRQLLQSATTPR